MRIETRSTTPQYDLADVVEGVVAADADGLEQALYVADVPADLRPSLSALPPTRPSTTNGCHPDQRRDGPTSHAVFGDASSSTQIVLFSRSHLAGDPQLPTGSPMPTARAWRRLGRQLPNKLMLPTRAPPIVISSFRSWRSAIFDG